MKQYVLSKVPDTGTTINQDMTLRYKLTLELIPLEKNGGDRYRTRFIFGEVIRTSYECASCINYRQENARRNVLLAPKRQIVQETPLSPSVPELGRKCIIMEKPKRPSHESVNYGYRKIGSSRVTLSVNSERAWQLDFVRNRQPISKRGDSRHLKGTSDLKVVNGDLKRECLKDQREEYEYRLDQGIPESNVLFTHNGSCNRTTEENEIRDPADRIEPLICDCSTTRLQGIVMEISGPEDMTEQLT